MDFVARERTALIVTEAVFLSVLIGWAVFRAYDPAIDHTEQPMDFMFLNATVRSYLGSPEDPWFRGEPVSYYYFGYWMMGALTKLTGIPSNVSYNLSMALIPALGAMGIFGLVYNMVRSEASRLRYAVAGGIAAALLLTVAANLEGVLEFMRANAMGSAPFWDWVGIDGMDGAPAALSDSWRPQEFMWWWRATRVIGAFDGGQTLDYTIHEFPFFSFILGDLHPHVMSLPFVILFLAFCWQLLRSPMLIWRPFHLRTYATVVAMALSLGGLAFINHVGLAGLLGAFTGHRWVEGVFRPRRARMGGYQRRCTDRYGGDRRCVYLVPAALSWLHQSGLRHRRRGARDHEASPSPSRLGAVPGGGHALHPGRLLADDRGRRLGQADGGLVARRIRAICSLGVPASGTRRHVGRAGREVPARPPVGPSHQHSRVQRSLAGQEGRVCHGQGFALALSALGLLLIMGPELLYVDDAFGGAWERMNTVFKLYYQGWVLLAAASGFALYYWGSLRERVSGWRSLLTRFWAVGFAVLLVGTAYYPLAAAATKGNLFHEGVTLDGLAYIDQASSGEYGAIRLIRKTAQRGSAVLEAVGGDYTAFGRISASTGVPTVMGWEGHERQWRGTGISVGGALANVARGLFGGGETVWDRSEPAYGERDRDVATIYQTQDVEQAKELLAKYRVDHVYVGSRERQKYGRDGLSKFPSFMETIFDQDGVAVYRLRR